MFAVSSGEGDCTPVTFASDWLKINDHARKHLLKRLDRLADFEFVRNGCEIRCHGPALD